LEKGSLIMDREYVIGRWGKDGGPRVSLELGSRRVTRSEVEEKLRKIAADKPFIVIDPFYEGEMAYDFEKGLIYVNPEMIAIRVNMLLERFPEADWEERLKRMVRHELVHKNQAEYLRGRGLSIEGWVVRRCITHESFTPLMRSHLYGKKWSILGKTFIGLRLMSLNTPWNTLSFGSR
jgi:hypothetical protein